MIQVTTTPEGRYGIVWYGDRSYGQVEVPQGVPDGEYEDAEFQKLSGWGGSKSSDHGEWS